MFLIACCGLCSAETLQLKLIDQSTGTSTGVIDASSTDPGQVLYQGSLGDFNINVATGLGGPDQTQASLDLNSLDATPRLNNTCTSTSPCTLQLLLTETDITAPTGLQRFIMNWGGTAGPGSVAFSSFLDPGNQAFGQTTSLGMLSTQTTPFSGTSVTPDFMVNGPYSLTELVTIETTGVGTTSFDASVSPVPEPGSLMLLGSGLIGACATMRKKLFSRK